VRGIHFLMDRFGVIVLFLLNTLLTVTVVQLDLLYQGASLEYGNIGYIALLSTVLLTACLLVDYARKRAYYRELENIIDRPYELEQALTLTSGATREQRKVQQAMAGLYRVFADTLAQYKRTQERHLHQLQQWAHQMKTPVAVIDLLTQETEEPRREVLESIREENGRIHDAIAMMLHAARLEHWEKDVRVRRTDLTGLVRGAVNEFRSAWIKFGVFPKLIGGEAPVEVETDEKWTSFILKQILSNAIKYSAAASAKQVFIEVAQSPEGASVTITDEGVGIPPQDLPRVFEPFFTGVNGRIGAESTGMGLYLAKEVCGRLGHRIEMESSVGVGTSVKLVFPRSNAVFAEPLGR